jgi:hypothetical protein
VVLAVLGLYDKVAHRNAVSRIEIFRHRRVLRRDLVHLVADLHLLVGVVGEDLLQLLLHGLLPLGFTLLVRERDLICIRFGGLGLTLNLSLLDTYPSFTRATSALSRVD